MKALQCPARPVPGGLSSPRASQQCVPRPRSRGMAMLEVAIATVVVSASFLGVGMMIAKNAREQRSAQFMGVAAQLAQDLAERMQANRASLASGTYVLSETYANLAQATVPNPTCGGPYARPPDVKLNLPPCTSASEMATYDLANWRVQVQTLLAGGVGAVVVPTAGPPTARTIVVAWAEPVIDKRNGTPTPVVDATCAAQAPGLQAPVGTRCYAVQVRP